MIETLRELVESTSFRFGGRGVEDHLPRSTVENGLWSVPQCLQGSPHSQYVATLSLASADHFLYGGDSDFLQEIWERVAVENIEVFQPLPVDYSYFLGLPDKRWTAKESLYVLQLYRSCAEREFQIPFSDMHRWWFLLLTAQFYRHFPNVRLSYASKKILQEVMRIAVYMSSHRSASTWMLMRDKFHPLVLRVFREIDDPKEVKTLLWYLGRLGTVVLSLTSTNTLQKSGLESILESTGITSVKFTGDIRRGLYKLRKELYQICAEG